MTQEEKAKAYDEAIEKARQLCAYPTTKPFISDLQDIFPELKESKDELTWLKMFIKEEIDCLSFDIRDSEDRVKLKNLQRSIAWLEKQVKKDEEILVLKDQIESLHAAIKALKEAHKIELEKQCEQILANSAKTCKNEQKPAWSEEDEKILDGVISNYESGYLPSVEKRDEIIKKLKSLKDRLQHQNYIYYNPYKEVVESITEMCKHYDKASHNGLRDFYDNVKVKCKDAKEYDSLYPHNIWKPNDEQIEALEKILKYFHMMNAYGETIDRLKELLGQLKKLK